MPAVQNSKSETIRLLREQLQPFRPQWREPQPSGCAALDRLLPGGGLPCGGIVECLGDTGDGAVTLSLWMAQQLCCDEGMLAVVDRRQEIYPPAMSAMGVDLERTILVHPQSRRDEIWTLIQCLRCPSITAVWSYLERLDAREYRCLQLAAETSDVVGMFARPTIIRGQPTWANVQLLVTPRASEKHKGFATREHRRFKIEVVNCQQGASGKSVTIDMDAITGEFKMGSGTVAGTAQRVLSTTVPDPILNESREHDESFSMYLASQLANPPVSRRAARA